MPDLSLCAKCGDPRAEHRSGIGACVSDWEGQFCKCESFEPKRETSAPTNAARSCREEDMEMLVDPRLFAPGGGGQYKDKSPSAYRPRCKKCGWALDIYVTERAANYSARGHLGLAGVAG